MKKILLLLFFFTLHLSSNASVIKISSGDNSIENALDNCSDGDTILIAPGRYEFSNLINIDKSITIASNYIYTHNDRSIDSTIFKPAKRKMHEWFELSAKNAKLIGFTFIGNDNHIVNISASYAYVTHCKFYGGKDQLSFSGGGGYVGYCYFENAGDDALDCDNSIDWIIEHNIIVNAFQDGIEIRLHNKNAPLTKHYFRYNMVFGAGESGIQLIDYKGDSFREFYINNNLFQNCQGAGVSCMYKEKDNTNEVYKGSLMLEKAYVYNNTFSACNYGLTISPGLLILNNIFLNIKSTAVCRGIYVNDSNDLSIVDYSCFYNNKNNFDKGVILGENNFINVNPNLDHSLLLKKGGSLIDKGVAQYEWKGKKLNISKNEFYGKAPDIGCFEYGTKIEKIKIPIVSVGKDKILLYPKNSMELNGIIYESGAKTVNRIKWQKIDGPGSVGFSGENNLQTKVEFSQQGIYKIRLSGWSNKNNFSDEIKIYYVKDYKNNAFKVDKNRDALFDAAKYKYLIGYALVDNDEKSILAKEKNDIAYYEVGTKYAGSYYVWLRLAKEKKTEVTVSIYFDDINNEKDITIGMEEAVSKYIWKKVKFDKIPEGYYPLIIKAKTDGVIWDKVFITADGTKKPF